MPLLRSAVLLVTLCVSTAAAAGGYVCLRDSADGAERNAAFVLRKLRLPRKPGEAVPVSGFWYFGGFPHEHELPLSGTLIRDLDGHLRLGLTQHFQSCLLAFELDESLVGTVSFDCDFDRVNDKTDPVEPVDCETVLPAP
jgi:hypothetical protein